MSDKMNKILATQAGGVVRGQNEAVWTGADEGTVDILTAVGAPHTVATLVHICRGDEALAQASCNIATLGENMRIYTEC